MEISIFNDVIGPVMRGPSSSHCAAALRIGQLARDLIAHDLQAVVVEFDRHGSLATTHETQGSDLGLFAGLLGWSADDSRLLSGRAELRRAGVDVAIRISDLHDDHPSTYHLTVRGSEESHQLVAISTGGGMIRVISIDGLPVVIDGDCWETLVFCAQDADQTLAYATKIEQASHLFLRSGAGQQLIQIKSPQALAVDDIAGISERSGVTAVRQLQPVLPVVSRPDATAPFFSCRDMLAYYGGQLPPLWQAAVDYEMKRGGMTVTEVRRRMGDIVAIVRNSVRQGLAGTDYPDRVLGYQSGQFEQCRRDQRLLPIGAMNRTIAYVTALMEVKSAMGVIVAAPTAGSCAALPGVCLAIGDELDLPDETVVNGMLAAGLIGVFIAARSTFAAEVAGCQAECGAAACMAAAGLVTMHDGSAQQALAAASMALQNLLGLVCDPVANRVEVPCLGKNVTAAATALSMANMALADFDAVIPLDETIKAADTVGRSLPRPLRCTALGGLSMTTTSQHLVQSLGARMDLPTDEDAHG